MARQFGLRAIVIALKPFIWPSVMPHANGPYGIFMRLLRTSVIGLAALSLAACAGSASRYPSLALRDVEKQDGIARGPSIPVAEPAPIDVSRINALRSDAQTAHDRFMRQRPNAAALVARGRGQATESDARGRALVAIADLTAIRSATFVPLSELDRMAADTAVDYGNTAPVAAAQAAVLAMIAEQDRSLGELWGALGQ